MKNAREHTFGLPEYRQKAVTTGNYESRKALRGPERHFLACDSCSPVYAGIGIISGKELASFFAGDGLTQQAAPHRRIILVHIDCCHPYTMPIAASHEVTQLR